MSRTGRLWALLVLAALGWLQVWPLLAAGVLAAGAVEVFLLWLHPYGKCGDLFHRGRGQNVGSTDDAYGICPRCHGKNVPRWGAAGVAALVGEKYGRRYWAK